MSTPRAYAQAARAALSPRPLPEHWSTAQALAVWELLTDAAERVRHHYEGPLVELILAELRERHPEQLDLFDPDDLIPF